MNSKRNDQENINLENQSPIACEKQWQKIDFDKSSASASDHKPRKRDF